MSAGDPALIVYPEVVAFGGEERVLLTLAEYLHLQRIPYRIVCYRDRVGLARFVDFPLPIESIAPAARGFVGKTRALARCLEQHRGSARRPLLFGLQAASHVGALQASDYFIRIADTPSLLSPALGLVARAKSAVLERFAARGLRRAAGCIANADYIGEEMQAVFGVGAMTVYVPGKAPPQPERAPDRDCRRILSVSRLEANKRIDWLIDAVADLARDAEQSGAPPIRLDIVGTGPLADALQGRAARAGTADVVRFHGFIDDAALDELYRRATLFAMPARQGFGLPALEALYRGVPVVQHRESGVSEILGGTPWVELFDGGTDTLRAALGRMLDRLRGGAIGEALPWLPSRDSFGAAVVDICRWSAKTS